MENSEEPQNNTSNNMASDNDFDLTHNPDPQSAQLELLIVLEEDGNSGDDEKTDEPALTLASPSQQHQCESTAQNNNMTEQQPGLLCNDLYAARSI